MSLDLENDKTPSNTVRRGRKPRTEEEAAVAAAEAIVGTSPAVNPYRPEGYQEDDPLTWGCTCRYKANGTAILTKPREAHAQSCPLNHPEAAEEARVKLAEVFASPAWSGVVNDALDADMPENVSPFKAASEEAMAEMEARGRRGIVTGYDAKGEAVDYGIPSAEERVAIADKIGASSNPAPERPKAPAQPTLPAFEFMGKKIDLAFINFSGRVELNLANAEDRRKWEAFRWERSLDITARGMVLAAPAAKTARDADGEIKERRMVAALTIDEFLLVSEERPLAADPFYDDKKIAALECDAEAYAEAGIKAREILDEVDPDITGRDVQLRDFLVWLAGRERIPGQAEATPMTSGDIVASFADYTEDDIRAMPEGEE